MSARPNSAPTVVSPSNNVTSRPKTVAASPVTNPWVEKKNLQGVSYWVNSVTNKMSATKPAECIDVPTVTQINNSNNASYDEDGNYDEEEPPEYLEQKEIFQQQQKQLEHDEAMARIMEEDRKIAENEMFDNEMNNQHTKKAFEIITEQRALMSVNRDNLIPSYHGWIQYILTHINGWIVFVGLALLVGSIWAYFKDLHLDSAAEFSQNLLFLQICAILFAILIFIHGQLGKLMFTLVVIVIVMVMVMLLFPFCILCSILSSDISAISLIG